MNTPDANNLWIPAILTQSVIDGRFTDLKHLPSRSGGFTSYVFDALDSTSGLRVVLKFLQPDLQMKSPLYVKKFQREGEICKALSGHPNIIQLIAPPGTHELLVEIGGFSLPLRVSYLALEKASKDFDAYLFGKRHHPPSLVRRLEIMREIVRGVARLHRLGYTHRDLKPDNVFLFPKRVVCLADLGHSAKINDSDQLEEYYDQPVGHSPRCQDSCRMAGVISAS